jgi:hypothetical protein
LLPDTVFDCAWPPGYADANGGTLSLVIGSELTYGTRSRTLPFLQDFTFLPLLFTADPKCGGTPTRPTGLDYTDIIIIVVVVAGVVLGLAAFLIYKYIAKP